MGNENVRRGSLASYLPLLLEVIVCQRGTLIASVAGLLVVALGASAAAQTIAVKAGINSSNITESPQLPGDTLQPNTGVMAGVSLTAPMGRHSALQIEGLFSRKGNTLINGEAGIDSKLTIDYLEIPVLASIHVISGPPIIVRVNVGPAFGFKLHRKETGFGNALPEDQQIKTKGFDLGIAFGAEVEHKALIVGARYTLGTSNIFDDDPAIYGVDKLTNRVFAVYGGWLLHK